MTETQSSLPAKAVLGRESFAALVDGLRARGYRVIGPVLSDGAILFDEIETVADLPAGWTDDQAPGSYRLRRREDAALFGHVVGPQSWKRWLYPAEQRLWRAKRQGQGFEVLAEDEPVPAYAFLGLKACDLAAIAIFDKTMDNGSFTDPGYRARRDAALLVAVNCGEAGETCFCTSQGTGPKANAGFDLALTELLDNGRHDFLIETGSAKGAEILSGLPIRAAGEGDLAAASAAVANAVRGMGRQLDNRGLPEFLNANLTHSRWQEIATRCLNCANCTMVCPTCFCTNVEDVTDLSGDNAERWRKWDSCFTLDHSYIHGGAMRISAASRYRQWMTHKLANWVEQFGVSGCVGCGRCIAWCPVGIDITEEVRAMKESRS